MDLGLAGRACVVTGASRGIGRETARHAVRRGRHGAAGRPRRGAARGGDRRRSRRRRRAGGARRGAGARRHRRRRRRADRRRGERALRRPRRARQQRRHRALARPRRRPRRGLVRGMGAERDGAAAGDAGRRSRAMAERGWGRIVNVCSTAGKRPSAAMPEYSVAKAAELSLSRLFADRYADRRRARQRDLPRARSKSELWMEPRAACSTSRRRLAGDDSREQALDAAGAKRPIGRLAEVERDRRGDRLPLLRARLLRRRRRLVGRRRHRAGDHLTRPEREALRAA